MSSANGKNLVVNESSHDKDGNSMSLLATLMSLKKREVHVFGVKEEDLRAASSLKGEDFNEALNRLLNQHECIRHRFSQEGTAGPFAHRYVAVKGVTLTASWPEEETKSDP